MICHADLRRASAKTISGNGFFFLFKLVRQPFLDLRLPGQAFASGNPVNLQNHPVRHVHVHAFLAMVAAEGFFNGKIVRHVRARVETRF